MLRPLAYPSHPRPASTLSRLSTAQSKAHGPLTHPLRGCRVLTWGQEKIGKSYLVDGRLEGPDVAQSGAPQRWGIKRAADLLVWVPSDVVVTNMEALASAASASFGAASDALLQQLGSLALPSLAEEEEEGNGASAAAGAKPKLTAQSSRSSLLARRLSQRLLSQGAQSLRLPTSSS